MSKPSVSQKPPGPPRASKALAAPTISRLVANAVDYLNEATAGFQTKPKHSVVAFYTAVELLLKARLAHEHWSLVVTKDAEYRKFISGDFHSVTLNEACSRLEKVVESSVPEAAKRSFNGLQKHRNKMVHFYHEGEGDSSEVEQIALAQLVAWHFLVRLIGDQWSDVFGTLDIDLEALDRLFRGHRLYLKARFDSLSEELRKRKSEGKQIVECPVCRNEAIEVEEIREALFGGQCLVCRIRSRWLIVKCPQCEAELKIEADDGATCEACKQHFNSEDLVSELNEDNALHDHSEIADTPGNCSECSGYHSIIAFKGYYLCTSCLQDCDDLQICGWCNEANNGDMTDSEWKGCSVCDGRVGWEGDD